MAKARRWQEDGRIERVGARLEEWRSRPGRRRHIPAGLWAGAVDLAGKHGVGLVSRKLRLDYYSLKRRVEERQQPGGNGARAEGGFVELRLPDAGAGSCCVIEIRGRGGATMLVRLAVAELDRVAGLAEAFWRLGQ